MVCVRGHSTRLPHKNKNGAHLEQYHSRLTAHFRAYRTRRLPGLPDGILHHGGVPLEYVHILPRERFELNILPVIRVRFWRWFEAQSGNVRLHHFFHHLNSAQALCFNLFFPFLADDGRTVDSRLLHALGIGAQTAFSGKFETVLDKDENADFDFYLEAESGRKIFFDLKFSETQFGSCEDDERQGEKLELFRPHLHGHVDPQWFDEKTFFDNYHILRNISHLGCHADSRLFFVFPRTNENLVKSEETIAKIAAQAFGSRVNILYLEVLLDRILTLIKDDAALLEHFEEFGEKYVLTGS